MDYVHTCATCYTRVFSPCINHTHSIWKILLANNFCLRYECFDNFKSKTPRPMTLYPRMVEEMIGADGNKKIVDVQDKSARATVDIIFLYKVIKK